MNATMSLPRFTYLCLVAFCTVALVLLSTAQTLADTEIYKSVDAKGRVTYSDRPTPSAQRIYVQSDPKISEADRARMASERETRVRADQDRARQIEAEQRERAALEKADQTIAQRCRQARDRYLMFSEANRLYRRDEAGNRVYYSSAEIDAERAAAEKMMKELCGGAEASR